MRIPHFIHKIITYKKYGITCYNASNLNDHIARQIVNGIQYMLDDLMGHPAELNDEQQWIDILTKIQKGFKEWIVDGGHYKCDEIDYKEKEKEFNEAMKLFSKYYMYLWN